MDKIELLDKLRATDEITILELLNITSTDLVDAFLDKIDEREDYLYKNLED